ncbi:MAG TPA: tRNA-uridine aminocarboxypropyltransferase [Kofleriaceae bacterium]|nr:tRNA-uridine aminocarboxypropyltransferase [Kofleriaceae bacterium]
MLCASCRLHASLCICALVPRLHTRTRLVLLVTQSEARKPSNTGQLAARCLANSTVEIVRKNSGPLQAPAIHAGELPLVLYPAPHAIPLTAQAASRSVALIVPDGSWHQARALQQRAALRNHTCVTLPPLGPSEYRLRSEPQAGGLATFEAIARALRILEDDDAIADTMLHVFRTMVERTLWFRGKLHAHEVTGGIPAAALANDPRGTATRAAALTTAAVASSREA